MDQAGSNDEKNWGSKISLDCPFKKKKKSLEIYMSDHSDRCEISQITGIDIAICTIQSCMLNLGVGGSG